MEEQRLKYLLEQYLAETATAAELEELSNCFRSEADAELSRTLMAGMMQEETPVFPADEALYRQMEQEILAIDRHPDEVRGTAPARILRMVRWPAAAAVLILLALGGYFWAGHRTQLAVGGAAVQDSIISTH